MRNEAGPSVSLVNDGGTCQQIDTRLTRDRSLIVLAQHLLRQRSSLPPQRRSLTSTLIQQIYRYDANPEAMRQRILQTIEAIENAA